MGSEKLIVKQEGGSAREESKSETEAHQEAMDFVERNRNFFEHYARGRVKFEPAPPGLDTFAFNLETNTIYINSRFYKDLGLSDAKTSFATLHEVEHFLEKLQMLAERRGDRKFGAYLERIKKSKAYGHMDNCVADIRENRSVVSRTSESFCDLERSLYRDDLFKETDFTSHP